MISTIPTFKNLLCIALLGLLPVVIILIPSRAYIEAADDVLADPIALGAWLYEGNCERCHFDYEDARFAEEYEDIDELKSAIEADRCQVEWGIIYGGPLRNRDIQAVAEFLLTWEELDEAPPLPELPPQPKDEPVPFKKEEKLKPREVIESEQEENPKLNRILADNPLAKGGYLYTRNCYRCHLEYEKNRMGQNFARDSIRTTISDGKTSTQMTPFSNMKGGDLSGSEIDAITDYIMTWERLKSPPAIPELVLEVPGEDPSALQPVGLPQFKTISGDIRQGHKLYIRHCSTCHGQKGEGYIGKPLNKSWWVKRYDLFAKSVIKNGVPLSLMPPWSESAGGPLGAVAVEDLVTLIVNWAEKQSGNN